MISALDAFFFTDAMPFRLPILIDRIAYSNYLSVGSFQVETEPVRNIEFVERDQSSPTPKIEYLQCNLSY
jgi:hypothetical protein